MDGRWHGRRHSRVTLKIKPMPAPRDGNSRCAFAAILALCETFLFTMNASSAARRRKAVVFFVAILASVVFVAGFAALHPRDWSVPPEVKRWRNPATQDAFDAAQARSLYREKCASCHGDTGKGDGDDAPLWGPKPTDFTSARLASQSDGELFYKISQGRRPMPGFRNRLTDRQRWELVLYLRSLSEFPPAPPIRGNGAKAPATRR
jgi:mono/diheme cytochrome c family protein